MPEDTPVDPYHDPEDEDWVFEHEPIYPWRMPARHYLGWAINGCKWDGRGFFYEPRPDLDPHCVSLVMRVLGGQVTAGNRLPRIRTALYRAYRTDGRLLYVGISGDPWKRFEQHAKDKAWWPQVVETRVEWFSNRRLALAAEADAIKAEEPTHNIIHNRAAA